MNNETLLLKDQKRIFDTGICKECWVTPAPMQNGYNLTIHTKTGYSHSVRSQRSPSPKLYKTIDAAASEAKNIGFIGCYVKFS